MPALLGPYLAAALLLIAAGAPKVRNPAETLRSARETGLPVSAAIVRLFGAAEVAVGLAAVLLGGPVPALLVGASYLGFAVFVARGLVRKDLTSCGCFSGDDSPPSVLHVVLDTALAVSAFAVASAADSSWLGGADASDTAALGLTALVDAGLLYLVLAKLPRVGPRADTAEVAHA